MKPFLLLSRLPEFKSFEELEPPKHSKVKRQSSTPSAPELGQQPDVNISEWKDKPTHEILQKLNVRQMQFPHGPRLLGQRLPESDHMSFCPLSEGSN